MSKRRPKLGRVKVPFDMIERVAADVMAQSPYHNLRGPWQLTRHSAFHRCKNGTFTLNLVWHGPNKETLTQTIRGLRVEGG